MLHHPLAQGVRRFVEQEDVDVSESFDGRRVESFSDRDLLASIGLRYAFPSGLGVFAEYQRVDLDLGSASVGASWRF